MTGDLNDEKESAEEQCGEGPLGQKEQHRQTLQGGN